MSDIIYRVIPDHYAFFPENPLNIEGAIKILEMYLDAEKISSKSYENPAFIDCGTNLESILCPYCESNIDFDVWQEMMDKCFKKSSFNDLSINLLCCNNNSTLNNLKYYWDCGFAKFVIEIFNPKYPPCKHDLYEASKCFGKQITFKMIVANY